jgi:hypothetical protein
VRTHAASKGGYQNKDAIVEFVPVQEQHIGDLRGRLCWRQSEGGHAMMTSSRQALIMAMACHVPDAWEYLEGGNGAGDRATEVTEGDGALDIRSPHKADVPAR